MKIPATLMLLASAVLLTACASTGNTPGQANQVAATDNDNLRCKTMIKTGTRLGTKVCKTEEQWRQDARDSREATEDIQRTSTHGPAAQGG